MLIEYYAYCSYAYITKEEGTDPELIQSNTTPDLGHHIGK